MHDPGVPEGFRAVFLDSVDSTMAEAHRRVSGGDPGKLWIVAREQTAGRGRRGRRWVSKPGNLYATLLLKNLAPAERLGELCFIAGVALHDAASQFIDVPRYRGTQKVNDVSGAPGSPAFAGDVGDISIRLRLKWPNDLLLDGAKLAGILIESESGGKASHIAIGFGVNCAHAPSMPGYPVTSLGSRTSPEVLFALLGGAMASWLEVWDRGARFDRIRAAWLARAKGVGEPIIVRLADRTLEGVFDSLGGGGQLLLRLASGVVKPVAAGEVFFGQAG